jgi:hypothetical protein
MAERKKKAPRRHIGAKGHVEPEDIIPKVSESQPLAKESQSLRKDTSPSTAMRPGKLNSEDKTPEDKIMETEEKGIFENTSELGRNLFSLDGAKKLAEFYIETTEKLTDGVLSFQSAATEWAKDTPLAAVLEAQHSMARKLVEFSTGTVRRLWRIEEKRAA